jgi:hypothetical protein
VIRLSGGMLVVVLLTGVMMGVVVADNTDSASEATISMDYDTGQPYVAGEPLGPPMLNQNGRPITNISAGEKPIAEHPVNVVDWSPYRVSDAITKQGLQMVFWTATVTAQTIHRSPMPVDWWVQVVDVGVLLVMFGYPALKTRSLVKSQRR